MNVVSLLDLPSLFPQTYKRMCLLSPLNSFGLLLPELHTYKWAYVLTLPLSVTCLSYFISLGLCLWIRIRLDNWEVPMCPITTFWFYFSVIITPVRQELGQSEFWCLSLGLFVCRTLSSLVCTPFCSCEALCDCPSPKQKQQSIQDTLSGKSQSALQLSLSNTNKF